MFSQGILYNRGESGFDVLSGLFFNRDFYGLNGNLSYTIDGIFTLGGLAGISNSEKLKLHSLSIGPYIIIYPLKYSKEFPISLSISGGYLYTDIQNSEWFTEQIFYKINTISLSSGISYHISLKDNLQLIPCAILKYDFSNSEYREDNGYYFNRSENLPYLILNMVLGYKYSSTLNLMAGSSLAFGLNNKNDEIVTKSFYLSIGITQDILK